MEAIELESRVAVLTESGKCVERFYAPSFSYCQYGWELEVLIRDAYIIFKYLFGMA